MFHQDDRIASLQAIGKGAATEEQRAVGAADAQGVRHFSVLLTVLHLVTLLS